MNYLYGYGVSSENKRKANIFLWIAVITNLGILGLFKYYNFFVSQFQKVGSEIGIHINPILLEIGLPVGISFYTFHGMSYLFDVHKGSRKPVNKIIEYAVFICFFPLLVSGPIERSNHLLPQIKTKRIFNYSQAVEGCRLILWGMFKKVVIADSIAFYVDDIFNNYSSHNSLTLILGVIGFSIQIYGDFSGYTDIAIGTAKLFGFELLSNFKFPYFSRDVAEFWRRWHISLTSWFRDYLYIPLGGSKKGKIINIKNVTEIYRSCNESVTGF
jgi:D-alanyl-lipoteichoic acid acyltransferase DltB (MBOAT superfamily)